MEFLGKIKGKKAGRRMEEGVRGWRKG